MTSGCPLWVKADMCAAKGHVRFTPKSDRESGLQQPAMSTLPQIADMCDAVAHVGFGPKPDMVVYSMTSSAVSKSFGGMAKSATSETIRPRQSDFAESRVGNGMFQRPKNYNDVSHVADVADLDWRGSD